MIATVQTKPQNLKIMQPIIDKFDALVYIDKNQSNLKCFIETLDLDVHDYRLHFQDNIIIADRLEEYVNTLIDFMERHNVLIMSIGAPPLKRLVLEYFLGKRIADYRNDRYIHCDNTASIYSKKFIDIMRANVKIAEKSFDDVSFINSVLEKTGNFSYVHLPALVYKNSYKLDNLFDKNFLTQKRKL